MGFYYEHLIRPLLFRQDPEKAHDLGVTLLDYLGRPWFWPLRRLMEAYNLPQATKPIQLFGLQFPTAVGLAAGMDKNGKFWRVAPSLGFGHVEIGTVTYHAQPGNERPRVFRYPEYGAIINRMGFNNDGAEALAKRLRLTRADRRKIPLGINIGKSKVATIEEAATDYLKTFHLIADYADYVTINVSSPNTHDLRKLQGREHLPGLLRELVNANRSRAKKLGTKPVPLLLKIAPDLSFTEIDEILAVIMELELAGIIATNTTVDRPRHLKGLNEGGGLSGKPLHTRAVQIVNYISEATHQRLPIIGVGGVNDARSAGAFMDAGASLVQLYTAMIYHGPFIAKHISRALAARQRAWL